MRSQLEDGLARLGLVASDQQLDMLVAYLELMRRWNKAFNLTAVTDPRRMVSHHLLDSLSIHGAFAGRVNCLDVGTGAGLPGIPLAILLPETRWTLLDSNGKKTRFVQQVIAEFGLGHVKVVQCRVQDYHAASDLDVIVSRAYASLREFVTSVEHLWGAATQLISMKTELAGDELDELSGLPVQVEIQRLDVPGIRDPRSLITVKRQDL